MSGCVWEISRNLSMFDYIFFFQQKLLYVNILASSELGGLYSSYIVLSKITKENIILNFGFVCSVFAFSS